MAAYCRNHIKRPDVAIYVPRARRPTPDAPAARAPPAEPRGRGRGREGRAPPRPSAHLYVPPCRQQGGDGGAVDVPPHSPGSRRETGTGEEVGRCHGDEGRTAGRRKRRRCGRQGEERTSAMTEDRREEGRQGEPRAGTADVLRYAAFVRGLENLECAIILFFEFKAMKELEHPKICLEKS